MGTCRYCYSLHILHKSYYNLYRPASLWRLLTCDFRARGAPNLFTNLIVILTSYLFNTTILKRWSCVVFVNSDAEGGEARAGGGRSRSGGTRRGVSVADHATGWQPKPAHQLPPTGPRLWRYTTAPNQAWGAHGTAEDVWSKLVKLCFLRSHVYHYSDL